MADDDNVLPSDREDPGLKPQPEKKPEPSSPAPDDKKVEEDPSEQPS